MKLFFIWATIYIPAVIICLSGFFLSTGLGVLMGLGGAKANIYNTDYLIVVSGIFFLPLVIFSIATFLYLKITQKMNIPNAKKNVAALFWIPFLIIYYLLLLAPGVLILLVILLIVSIVVTLLKKRVWKTT